jgi:hypothetical protein
MDKIKTWRDHFEDCDPVTWKDSNDAIRECMEKEIADLRAALASSATTEPVNGEFKQKLNKLIQDCTNLAFDCGEFAEITPSTVDAYEKIVSASEEADQALRDFVIGAVSGARSAAALAKQVPAQEQGNAQRVWILRNADGDELMFYTVKPEGAEENFKNGMYLTEYILCPAAQLAQSADKAEG